MANTRISNLTASASNLASTDLAPVVQTVGVGPVKMTGAQIAAGLLSATTPIGSGPILSRGGSATLQLGAADVASGAVAQTLQVQSNTGAATTGPNFTIKGSSGTTAGGSIIFQTHNGTAYSTALTIDSTKLLTVDTKALFPNGAYNAPSICISTTSKGFYYNSTQGALYTFDGGDRFYVKGANAGVCAGGAITWSNSDASAIDTYLYRDAANTLALKNSTNPQIFRVYSTTASSGSYGIISAGVQPDGSTAQADTLYIGSAGAGLAMTKLALVQNGTTRLYVDANGNLNTSSATAYSFGSGIRTVEINGSTSGFNTAQGALTFNSKTGSNGANAIYCAGGAMSFYAGSTTFAAMTEYLILSTTGLLQFQGTSSSFPALKRISSGNCLQVIAADNTASAGFIVGNQALTTTATDGFLYVPTCAGTPTGTPTTQTGTAPIVVDTTNNKLYFYSGGQWRDAGP